MEEEDVFKFMIFYLYLFGGIFVCLKKLGVFIIFKLFDYD